MQASRPSVAEAGTTAASLRMPGVVQPNAYKEVAVTSLVSGRVMQVRGELGQRVATGDTLATVYSPEMADAQTAFIVARADQVAHAQRQTRTQRLAAIGAVSREELETLEAERAMHDAAVEKARARLALLGIPEERAQRLAGPQDVVTTIDVRAPLAGVVTSRAANAGLNIDPATPLFTIVDLSTVWVIADLYERDFAKVRVGSPATVTSAAYPDLTLQGRVSYIDPQVQPETRTAKLRVEVPNASGQLRLGMYVDVQAGESVRSGLFVPTAAVQMVGVKACRVCRKPGPCWTIHGAERRGGSLVRRPRSGARGSRAWRARGDRRCVLSAGRDGTTARQQAVGIATRRGGAEESTRGGRGQRGTAPDRDPVEAGSRSTCVG